MSRVVHDAVIKEQTCCSISNSSSILHRLVTLVATSPRVILVYNDICRWRQQQALVEWARGRLRASRSWG
ncbi:MAG TPA: hypothetical protein VFA09_10430 [Ktedonobacteraceae bacterium]|nr:hypothetical protein [Ktedonobacteraceae bacterium]